MYLADGNVSKKMSEHCKIYLKLCESCNKQLILLFLSILHLEALVINKRIFLSLFLYNNSLNDWSVFFSEFPTLRKKIPIPVVHYGGFRKVG